MSKCSYVVGEGGGGEVESLLLRVEWLQPIGMLIVMGNKNGPVELPKSSKTIAEYICTPLLIFA